MTADEIAALVHGFETCTLPKVQWTHHAHQTVALCYLRQFSREEATQRLRTGIQRYNHTIGGSPDGYHETITLGWIAVIARFLKEHDHGQGLTGLRGELIQQCGDKDHLLRYWSKDVLLSDVARRGWVGPDRESLPDGGFV